MKGKGVAQGQESIEMLDGTQAWLLPSGRYFGRAEPSYEQQDRIVYYDLGRNHVPLASAVCPECGDLIESKHCGDFVVCSCTESYVDTDRWMAGRHRIGGAAATLTETERAYLKELRLGMPMTIARSHLAQVGKKIDTYGRLSNIVDVHVMNLRKKLGKRCRIDTVRGKGYQLIFL